ncbi:MAG: DUF5004 domain-containing protein [Prevotella sp.]|jgi:hypothetical protein
MNIKNIIKNSTLLAAIVLMAGCSSFDDDSNPYGTSEALKDLSGIWKLQNVTRNDIDITQEMDFTKFSLNIHPDGTYHIDNYLPFVVEKDGTWNTDNEQYPFRLTFTEDGATEGTTIDINYPIVNGSRSLNISLSPGCSSNIYTYTLLRSTETTNP